MSVVVPIDHNMPLFFNGHQFQSFDINIFDHGIFRVQVRPALRDNTLIIGKSHAFVIIIVLKIGHIVVNRFLQSISFEHSGYYKRYLLSQKPLTPAIEKSKRATGNIFLDNYVLDFLDVPDTVSERDLQKSIIRNLKNFILEIGKDFTFLGEEYRIQVGKHDYYIDLLFYHRGLSCLVAFELKIGEFKPEYVGKMDLYLEALDREAKKEKENPSVGVILCADKDDEVVEFTLSRSLSPTMVSEYNLKLIDKTLLQRKLKEYIELAETDFEEE